MNLQIKKILDNCNYTRNRDKTSKKLVTLSDTNISKIKDVSNYYGISVSYILDILINKYL